MTPQLQAATARITQEVSAMPTGVDGVHRTVADLDDLLGVLSSFTRLLSAAVEHLPDSTDELSFDQLGEPIPPDVACNNAAIHVQAAAAGIDQAQTAIRAAHHITGRLHIEVR
jgi:hypothetical protein